MSIRIKALERRWFDDFGQFCTYALKNAVIDEIVDEDELVWRIAKSLRDEEIRPDDIEGIEEYIMEIYGIAEEYIGLIMQRVRNGLRLLEAELKEADEARGVQEVRECRMDQWMDRQTYQQMIAEVLKMYLEEDCDRKTVIKAIMLQYGLEEQEAREVVLAAESVIFS